MKEIKRFAFVSNIIETKDVRLKAFYPILGYLIPLFIWKRLFIYRAKKQKGGYSCVCHYNVFGRVTGYTVLVEMTAEQLVSKRYLKLGKEKILQACLFAQNELGVNLICLGSLAKSITKEGTYLKNNGILIAVTHGDSYTVASAVNGVSIMEKQFGLHEPVVAVIGAYGKIGRALSLILVRLGYKVIAMGRDEGTLIKLKEESGGLITTTTSLSEALAKSDIAVMTTSATDSLITDKVIKKDRTYYIYDLGQPYNLFPADYWSLIKKGFNIIRIDGGFEGVNKNLDILFWMRLKKNVMYACYVEGVLQALENDNNNYVGPVNLDHVETTRARAKKWGFAHLPFTCYNKPLKTIVEEASKVAYSENKITLAEIAMML